MRDQQASIETKMEREDSDLSSEKAEEVEADLRKETPSPEPDEKTKRHQEMVKAVLIGSLSSIVPVASKVVRVFISSTFSGELVYPLS